MYLSYCTSTPSHGNAAEETGGLVGLPQVGGRLAGGAPLDGRGVHCLAPPDRPSGNRGPAHFVRVQGGGEAARDPNPPLLVGAGLRGGVGVDGSG